MKAWSMSFRNAGFLLLTLVILLVVDAISHAAAPRSRFKVGDKVEFTWLGKTRQGEVTSINPATGWVTARFDHDGREQTTTYPPDRFQPVKKGAVDAGAKTGSRDSAPTGRPAEGAAMRIWTDTTGQHKTEAQFLELAEGKVRLKKADGTTTTVPLERLSEADQKLAKQLAVGTATVFLVRLLDRRSRSPLLTALIAGESIKCTIHNWRRYPQCHG